jgi:hypothetical protein
VAVSAQTVLAPLASPVRLVFIVHEIVRVVVAHENDVTSPAAVAAIWPTPGLVFLTTEADTTAAAVAGLDFDDTLVDKHGWDLQMDARTDTNQYIATALTR